LHYAEIQSEENPCKLIHLSILEEYPECRASFLILDVSLTSKGSGLKKFVLMMKVGMT